MSMFCSAYLFSSVRTPVGSKLNWSDMLEQLKARSTRVRLLERKLPESTNKEGVGLRELANGLLFMLDVSHRCHTGET